MCAERVHRVLLSLLIVASVGLIHTGKFYEGSILLTVLAAAMFIWGLADFCIGIKILEKILPNCRKKNL